MKGVDSEEEYVPNIYIYIYHCYKCKVTCNVHCVSGRLFSHWQTIVDSLFAQYENGFFPGCRLSVSYSTFRLNHSEEQLYSCNSRNNSLRVYRHIPMHTFSLSNRSNRRVVIRFTNYKNREDFFSYLFFFLFFLFGIPRSLVIIPYVI